MKRCLPFFDVIASNTQRSHGENAQQDGLGRKIPMRLRDAIYKIQKNLNERQLNINPMTDIEEGNQVRMKTGLVKPWSTNFASVVIKITHAWLQRQRVCTTEIGVTCNLSVKLFLPI